MKKLFGFIIFVFLFAGCASLTKTQIRSVNAYSRLLEKNVNYPGVVINEFINIKYDVEKLNTGTFGDTIVNTMMWNSYNGKERTLENAKTVDVSIKVIGQYAAGLSLLSSENLSGGIKNSTDKLGVNSEALFEEYNRLNSMKISAKLGKLISQVTNMIGSNYIRRVQGVDLKEYIGQGDTLVGLITTNVERELDTLVLKRWIPSLKVLLKTNQENLLMNLNPQGDYKVYFATQFNRDVAQIISRIDNLESLTKETIGTCRKIRLAHHELLENVRQKKKIKDLLSETKVLFVSTEKICKTLESIQNGK
jgi:hypothetical protein